MRTNLLLYRHIYNFLVEPNGYPSLGFFLYLNLHTDVISLQNGILTFAP